jgi:tetratricopeptide (TPR) repeat protein
MAEKSSSEVPRAVRELYEKGRLNLERGNYDYAIALLNQVLQQEPTFYEARQALRATQFKKAGGSTTFLKKVFGAASSSPLLAKGQVLLRSNPIEAIHVAEQILNSDPHHTLAHKLLAEAALAAGLPKTAVLSLEIAYKHSPKDRDVALKLARTLDEIGQHARAEKVLLDLQHALPDDPDVVQALKDHAAHRTLTEGGYEVIASGEASYRDVLKDKDEAVRLEQEKREVKSDDVAQRLIHECEQRLQAEPDNARLLRQLADLHSQNKDFEKALQYLDRLAHLEGQSDPSLDKAIAETTAKHYDQLIAQLDPAAPDYAEQRARLQADKEAYLIEECKSRAERYPTDLAIRFELGELFFQAGKIPEAIAEFQKAQNNPHKRIPALRYLGQCFLRRGMHDLAARTLQNALKEKLVFDEEKKELIYLLGCAFEKMGQAQAAIEQFKLIYEADIGYKDVAAKVDAYYAAQG